MRIDEIINPDPPRLLLLFDAGQEDILQIAGDVLGEPYVCIGAIEELGSHADSCVIGLCNATLSEPELLKDRRRSIITTHCLDVGDQRDEALTEHCDYEYLYTRSPFLQRDLARFLGFVLGQIKPHDDLKGKARTTLLSTTFPDIRSALPNLDILSVGADSVELRVDLLAEPGRRDLDSRPRVPSLKYVGEQVMVLRQRTELPIIFTIRCTNENGKFPMDDPTLSYHYLRKALQWGCEYLDVELWLPQDIRQRLSQVKGHSKIISAFHDFSGNFKWTSEEAQELFRQGAVYGDVVKMIALIAKMEQNYDLETFRAGIQSTYTHPPLSGLNMGPIGQLSRTLNKVFTPITHPLLPIVAAPGQLSAAEINERLHSMSQLPSLELLMMGDVRTTGLATFFEKCLNELSLPHQIVSADRSSADAIPRVISKSNFGGAVMCPPLPAVELRESMGMSEAATAIGHVDTIVARSSKGAAATCTADNATWKGIRATLTRDFVPSAYSGRPAILLASEESYAAAAIFALRSLNVETIYTIGFKARSSAASHTQYFSGLEDLKRVTPPFVIVSALPAEKSALVTPLLKYYGRNSNEDPAGPSSSTHSAGKVFLDLSNGPKRPDPVAVAAALGWAAYGVADVHAWTAVETLRLLVGENVPFNFVKLASGNSLVL
ncbi:hypothetical protein B0A48_11252 [Cryoendolithus antarcticus]|uniref:Uncharacterized protein n=1 Tax=Cryoendolithus antarcticus TaxID=1507870 RepID=A0A1V8SV67_9PEZI|nr:hypothetical protein B0A48_11252 [Cryoendolithus antarcticus]